MSVLGSWERKDMTHLSMIVIKGATIEAAVNPETASDANLNPRFFVFHFLFSIGSGSTTLGARVIVLDGASRFIGAWDPMLGF